MSINNAFEVISCVTDNNTLVKKSYIENFNTQSQLIVNESQEALFYKEGQALDLFGPGRHTLVTENLPIFRKFFNHLFGNNTPVPCEVFFINKVSVLDVLWGTPSPIVLEDPQYHLIVNVKSSGQCGIIVKDSRKFIVKVVGQLPQFDVENVRRSIKGMMMTSLTNIIANTIVNEKIGILEIATRLEELSASVQRKLNEKLDDIGLETVHFNIGTIFTNDEDISLLKQAKARAAARATEGYTYQEEQKFDVLKTAAGNTSTAGGMIGMGVGIGAGLGFMGEIREQTGSAMNPAPAQPAANAPTKTCANCGAANDPGAKFCQECGSPMAPAKKFCTECGTQCEGSAKFCSVCGHKF